MYAQASTLKARKSVPREGESSSSAVRTPGLTLAIHWSALHSAHDRELGADQGDVRRTRVEFREKLLGRAMTADQAKLGRMIEERTERAVNLGFFRDQNHGFRGLRRRTFRRVSLFLRGQQGRFHRLGWRSVPRRRRPAG